MKTSVDLTVRFTVPSMSRDWFIHGWCNRWYDTGFCGIRVLGIDVQVGWWGIPLLRKDSNHAR